VNYDGVVNVEDLLALIAAWDSADPDADGNAAVTVGDLLLLLNSWTAAWHRPGRAGGQMALRN
jgi:hypothetical protein